MSASTFLIRLIIDAMPAFAPPPASAAPYPLMEHVVPAPAQTAADAPEFQSRDDAEGYLARAIPLATAGNPKYRGSEPGVLTQWLTKTVKFSPSANPQGILVSTSEIYLEFRNGVQSATATHDVEFAIEDVRISERTDDSTLTEFGEKALGVIFNCQAGKCIHSRWNGAASNVDWSDISIQDPSLRANILKAFQVLKQASALGG